MLEFSILRIFLKFLPAETYKFFWATKGGNNDFFEKSHNVFLGTRPHKNGGESISKEFFDFENFFLGDKKRKRRKEGTTERGNDWNDTTSALFKNLVCIV
jgi:hypothetical protein